jgi:predicted metal-dependent peptidase
MNKEESLRKINRAKIQIMTKSNTTFMSFLLSTLKIIITEEIPTLATDGKKLLINPEFIKDFNLDELIFCLMHETMHVAYQHMDRRGDLDPMLYNIAGDYVINLFLKDCGFTILKIALIDEKFRGWSTLKVYEYLLEENEQIELPWEDIIPSDTSENDKEEIIGNILQAKLFAEKSNDAGSIPGDLKRQLDKLTNNLA